MLNPLVFYSFVALYFGPWDFFDTLMHTEQFCFFCTLHCQRRLDVIVRPHRRHLRLERLERELERRARIPDLELLKHARV